MRFLHFQVFHSLIKCLELLIHGLVNLTHFDLYVSLVNELLLDGSICDSLFELLRVQTWRALVSRSLARLLNANAGFVERLLELLFQAIFHLVIIDHLVNLVCQGVVKC